MELLSQLTTPVAVVTLTGAAGVVLVMMALAMLLRRPKDPLERFREASQTAQTGRGQDARLRAKGRNAQLDRFASLLEPQDTSEYTQTQLKLRQAGYSSADAVRIFNAAKMILGLAGLGAGYFYVSVLEGAGAQEPHMQALYSLLPGAIGYYLPVYWITRRVEERKLAITQGFPDCLDMLLVCVEAGQSLDQAVGRVGNEMAPSCPHLAIELEAVSYELRAGKEKAAVLRDFADRCGVQDIRSFVSVLIQSATFGTSVGEALRVYAAEMRDKRVMRAEEAANKLPTKMTLATMMLTVPPLLIILVGPSVNGILQLGATGP